MLNCERLNQNRRSVLSGFASLLGTSLITIRPNASLASTAVQLIVIRDGSYINQCTKCIPGKVYGVPAAVDINSAETTPFLLEFLTDVIEPSFEENTPNISSVPLGTYSGRIREDATKRWMWSGGALNSGDVLRDRAWRIELDGVPNRTAIQFHYGKDVSWSAGCIIVGTQPTNQCYEDCKVNDSPEDGVKSIRSYVERNSISSSTPITIRIANG